MPTPLFPPFDATPTVVTCGLTKAANCHPDGSTLALAEQEHRPAPVRAAARGRPSDWLLFMATLVTSRLISTRSGGSSHINRSFRAGDRSPGSSLFCLCRRPDCNTSPETNERQAEAGGAASAQAQSPEVVA
jgi:hypothetical protein